MMVEIRNFIGGEWVSTGRTFDKFSPVTGEKAAVVHEAGAAEVDAAVSAGKSALAGEWGGMSAEARGAILRRIADAIERRADDFVAAECADVGLPKSAARAVNVARAAEQFRMFADEAAGFGGRTWRFRSPPAAGGGEAMTYTIRRPRGVVGAIAPWNVPLLLLSQMVAPALAAGNAAVAKPSEHTPRSASLLAEAARDCGIPDGALNVIHGFGGGSTGELMVGHRGVSAFAFTGESATGEAIARGAAAGLRDVSMELGGKNPALIFADADADKAAAMVARSSFFNCGQICHCTERVYVQRPIFERFAESLAAAAKKIKLGGPDDDAQMGPLVYKAHLEKVQGMIESARADGAEFLAGGDAPEFGDKRDGGFFVNPTVAAGLSPDSRFAREEVFGPVCHIAPFDTEEEAVALANDTDYGLSACVHTGDLSRAHRVAARLEAGMVWVNAWLLRDPRSPAGGLGLSGGGAARGGRESLEFFTVQTAVTMGF